jgi:glycosyltransferase involved in cell wall biosynthesis
MPVQEGLASAEPSKELGAIGSPRILYVGNLEKYQGVDLLLEAFLRLTERDTQAHLVIVGGSSAESAAQMRRFSKREVGKRIHFIGPRPLDVLPSLLTAADVLVSPRLQGINTPLKIYSYLASGRPIVATRLPTHTQVLNDEVAVLVEANPDALADGIGRLLADPALGAALAAEGRAYVEASFGRQRFEDRLRSFYWALEDQIKRENGGRSG